MTYLGQFMCAKSKKSNSIIDDSTNQTFQNIVSLNRTAQIDISKKSNLQREASQTVTEPYRVCRRVNILRDYPDEKSKIYP